MRAAGAPSRSPKRGRRLLGALIWALLAAAPLHAETCNADEVFLRSDRGQARFSVEVVDTAETRAQGLMHRESLPRSAGMLFVFEGMRVRTFWMKNTLIPLDMVFLDDRGVVVSVQANAVPHDLTALASDGPARFVLEINGGMAAALGIGPGTEMRHPAVASDLAAWPC